MCRGEEIGGGVRGEVYMKEEGGEEVYRGEGVRCMDMGKEGTLCERVGEGRSEEEGVGEGGGGREGGM